MPKLHNTTSTDIALPTGHIIPAKGFIQIEDDADLTIQRLSYARARLRSGDLRMERDHAPVEGELTRKSIAAATREELKKILTDLAVEFAPRLSTDDMRELAVESAFGQ